MTTFSQGKYALAISDRSGMAFPYNEMVREWNGALVHVSEYEPKQPQLDPKPTSADPQALQRARTARTEFPTEDFLINNPITTAAADATYTDATDVPYRFVPCMASGLAFYLAQKYAPQRVQELKLLYEDELLRAEDEDGSSNSTYISPKIYYPGV